MIESIPDTSKDKTVQEIPVLKTRKNMGNTVLPHGCKLWAINLADLNDIEEVEFKTSTLTQGFLGTNQIHHQAIYKKGYFYAMAINKKNALRKFWKCNPNFRSQ